MSTGFLEDLGREHALWALFFDQPLEKKIKRLAAHLADEHEDNLHLSTRPY